jgi:hypothetical protein
VFEKLEDAEEIKGRGARAKTLDALDVAVLCELRRYGFKWFGWNDDGAELVWTTDL